MVKGRTYEEVDLMRESRAEGDVIADIAAEELQAYLGNHPTTHLINHTTRQQANLPQLWHIFTNERGNYRNSKIFNIQQGANS